MGVKCSVVREAILTAGDLYDRKRIYRHVMSCNACQEWFDTLDDRQFQESFLYFLGPAPVEVHPREILVRASKTWVERLVSAGILVSFLVLTVVGTLSLWTKSSREIKPMRVEYVFEEVDEEPPLVESVSPHMTYVAFQIEQTDVLLFFEKDNSGGTH